MITLCFSVGEEVADLLDSICEFTEGIAGEEIGSNDRRGSAREEVELDGVKAAALGPSGEVVDADAEDLGVSLDGVLIDGDRRNLDSVAIFVVQLHVNSREGKLGILWFPMIANAKCQCNVTDVLGVKVVKSEPGLDERLASSITLLMALGLGLGLGSLVAVVAVVFV